MYDYLVGQITEVHPAYLDLEVAGVGYQLFVANPYRFQADQPGVKVYVYQVVRENEISLFGFYDQQEKQLFLKLISVSGIGPKSALAILANDDHQGLVNAISNDNVAYLTKFPGVGKKTAQQIVLDLKDKLKDLFETTQNQPEQTAIEVGDVSTELQDGLAALQALGYSEREIKTITKPLSTMEPTSADGYLREGLRLLMKK